MAARLRKFVEENVGTKLQDGRTLGGIGCLTKSEVDKLQNYYGLAIRRNMDNLEATNRAVWALFFHKLSTNDNPRHGLCPSDTDSWCKFKKFRVAYEHKYSLPAAVVDAIKPVFRDLASEDPLKRCL
jgi:hypothetical protein